MPNFYSQHNILSKLKNKEKKSIEFRDLFPPPQIGPEVIIKDFTKKIADDYYMRGEAYCCKCNWDAAIEDLTKAISLIDEEDAWHYFMRGEAYHFKGNYEAAIKDYNKALEINPDFDNAEETRSLLKECSAHITKNKEELYA